MLKLPIIVTIFIVLVTTVMISCDFQRVSAQVLNSTTTNSTSVSAITISGIGTGGIAYDPMHQTMYVTIQSDNSTSVIDTNTLKPLPVRIPGVGYSPAFIGYDPIHHTMYVSSASGNTVSVINTTTNSVIGNPIPLPPSRPTTLSGNVTLFNGLFGVTHDPIHKTMYVANIEPNTVSVINTTTNSVIGNPIPAGKQPQLAAYDPIHRRMYMTHNHDLFYSYYTNSCPPPTSACHEGNVTAISTDPPYSVMGRPIPAGIAPFLIAYDPLHNRMYVTNLGSSDKVYVIDVK
jgi:YVTN family beta-propeller protein